MQDDDDNDDPMILNIRAENHTSERTIVPWTVGFNLTDMFPFLAPQSSAHRGGAYRDFHPIHPTHPNTVPLKAIEQESLYTWELQMHLKSFDKPKLVQILLNMINIATGETSPVISSLTIMTFITR